MFDFLKLGSLGRGSSLGVDIGTASLKVVELTSEKGKLFLKNYGLLESHGHLERLNDAVQTSSLKILDRETAELLKKLLDEVKPNATYVTASLPAFSAFTALLDIPFMSSQETTQAMQFQAKQFVPLPLTEVAIDWIPVGQYEDEKGLKKRQIFLVSIPKEQIRTYQTIFRAAGLTLHTLEVETISLARLLTGGDPTTTLVVDVGARSTAIGVAKNGLLLYSAQTDFAGSALTQAIARGLSVNVRRAEDLKRQRGIAGGGAEYEVSTLMLPYVDAILNEVRRVKDAYERNYRGKIERIMLSGGGANLLGLEKYISEEMNIPTVKGAPFTKISYPPAAEALVQPLGAPLAVALGLAMRQFSER